MNRRRLIPLVVLSAAGLLSGCDKPRPSASKTVAKPANVGGSIIGKKTQTVFDVEPELAKGAVICTDINNPYYSALVKVVVPGMQHNLDIHHAISDSWPQNAQEFVDQILKADGVGLDKLPYYLEYGYEPNEHKLMILEYPERKKQRQNEGKSK